MSDAWQPGRAFGDALRANDDDALLGRYGLVFLDPLDLAIEKTRSSTLCGSGQTRPRDCTAAVETRSRQLEEAGYHAQVVATENSFPLFLHDADGARHALSRAGERQVPNEGHPEEYSAEELAGLALRNLRNFSPNVTTRCVR